MSTQNSDQQQSDTHYFVEVHHFTAVALENEFKLKNRAAYTNGDDICLIQEHPITIFGEPRLINRYIFALPLRILFNFVIANRDIVLHWLMTGEFVSQIVLVDKVVININHSPRIF